MNPPFYYLVKVKLIRNYIDGKIDFIEEEKIFENESPIIAREEAFNWYQNYIDVLLDGYGKKYTNDKEARKILKSFYHRKTTEVSGFFKDQPIFKHINGGIGIYLKLNEDPPINYNVFSSRYEDNEIIDIPIHSIGQLGSEILTMDEQDGFIDFIHVLSLEYKLYEYYKLSVKSYPYLQRYSDVDKENYMVRADYQDYILKTPFDFDEKNDLLKMAWENEESKDSKHSDRHEENPTDFEQVKQLLIQGEGPNVEFKPSLVFNFTTNLPGMGIKAIIAKAICGFLNSNGGFLLIGVRDNGEVSGLDADFNLSPDNKDPKDYFLLQLDDMLHQFFDINWKSNIYPSLVEIDNKMVCMVKVFPSKQGPVFIKNQGTKEFWLRTAVSTKIISDVEAIVKYCLGRWRDHTL